MLPGREGRVPEVCVETLRQKATGASGTQLTGPASSGPSPSRGMCEGFWGELRERRQQSRGWRRGTLASTVQQER